MKLKIDKEPFIIIKKYSGFIKGSFDNKVSFVIEQSIGNFNEEKGLETKRVYRFYDHDIIGKRKKQLISIIEQEINDQKIIL